MNDTSDAHVSKPFVRARYEFERCPAKWWVIDRCDDRVVKTFRTRKEARFAVRAMNAEYNKGTA